MDQTRAIVLCAGKGTRLHSAEHPQPKVLRQAAGRPLLAWVLDALAFLPPEQVILVGGYRKEQVFDAFPNYLHAVQEPQLGTGHAVQCAAPLLEGFDGTVLVCYGDMPLLKREAYLGLLAHHAASGAACTLLSGTSTEDLPYGRVLRDEAGNFQEVVEDRDCTPEQKRIRELNVGIYAFRCADLLPALGQLQNNNSQSEYYLTDVPALLRAAGKIVAVYSAELNEQLIGVNTLEQLQQVEAELLRR